MQAIAALQHLQCLGLSRCPAAHATALPALVAALPRLSRLHLNHAPLDDVVLSAMLRVTPAHCSSVKHHGGRCMRMSTPRVRTLNSSVHAAPAPLQGAPALQHVELLGTCLSAQPLWGLTRLRSLALDASSLKAQVPDHMDLLASLRALTRLQVLHALAMRQRLPVSCLRCQHPSTPTPSAIAAVCKSSLTAEVWRAMCRLPGSAWTVMFCCTGRARRSLSCSM